MTTKNVTDSARRRAFRSPRGHALDGALDEPWETSDASTDPFTCIRPSWVALEGSLMAVL